jgi:O-antigen/teichoic acid export membrane protein
MKTIAARPSKPTSLAAHLRTPLVRNGYALAANSLITSAIGVGFWVVAARRYSAETVGLNSAIISAMIFLSNLSQLNLANALNRFVPRAGIRTKRIVMGSYALAALLSAGAGAAFVIGINTWSPALAELRTRPLLGVAFVLAVAAWSLFVLEDAVLVGLRRAVWVPVTNFVFAVAKIGLLMMLAASVTGMGIFASWVLPLAFIILPTNLLIFRRLLPRHLETNGRDPERLSSRRIVRFVAGDYGASLLWTAAIQLMPIIVLERVGGAASAYYYLSWTITYSLYLLSRNMGESLTTEGALNQELLDIQTRRALRYTGQFLIPIAALVALSAPLLLRLFGGDYATEAGTLLRLLALSAVPNIVTSLFVSVARVKQQVGAIVATYAALCGMVLGLSLVLLGPLGIVAIGIAWLTAQILVALFLMAFPLRSVWVRAAGDGHYHS